MDYIIQCPYNESLCFIRLLIDMTAAFIIETVNRNGYIVIYDQLNSNQK